MKKLLCSCSSLVVLAACGTVFAGGPDNFLAPTPAPMAPAVQYFDGLNLGVDGSFRMVQFGNESSFFNNSITDTGNGNDQTGFGGVQGTFGKVFNDIYYVGVTGQGNFGSASDTFGVNNVFNSNFNTTNNPKISTDYGVSLKPGVIVGPDKKTLVYVRGGAEWADITTSASIGDDTSSNSNTELGWLAGVGAERFVDDNGNFSVNVEYDYEQYGDVNAGANADNDVSSSSTNVKQSALILGVNYYPGFSL